MNDNNNTARIAKRILPIKLMVAFCFLLILPACSIIPQKKLSGNVYDVGFGLRYKPVDSRQSLVLLVELPKARAPLLSSYLVIRDYNDRLTSYLLRMGDTLPNQLRTRIIEALRKAKIARLVLKDTSNIKPSMIIKTEIVSFEIQSKIIDDGDKKQKAIRYDFVFEVNFILLDIGQKDGVFNRNFVKKYQLKGLNDDEIIGKMKLAMHSVFKNLINWLDNVVSKAV